MMLVGEREAKNLIVALLKSLLKGMNQLGKRKKEKVTITL